MYYPSLASANLPITILKFGGSVLSGPDALTSAVAEIERTLRGGSSAVVVTSAFSGVTERLLNRAQTRFLAPAEKPLARLLATGESRSAVNLRRYDAASWDGLATVGGGLVQTKAIELARKHKVAFTIAAPLSDLGTRVAS